jgi:hypothetical protein
MAGDSPLGPVVMSFVNPDGSPRAGPALRYMLTHPHRIPLLVRLGRDAKAATIAAAGAAAANVRGSR